mmetsp:Transcript_83074/g.178068  ORF Transcript_83074/g.178068 Transcript_83074/m.178068 type:complete len:320 (-) Transcript_83074:745-1704(-)
MEIAHWLWQLPRLFGRVLPGEHVKGQLGPPLGLCWLKYTIPETTADAIAAVAIASDGLLQLCQRDVPRFLKAPGAIVGARWVSTPTLQGKGIPYATRSRGLVIGISRLVPKIVATRIKAVVRILKIAIRRSCAHIVIKTTPHALPKIECKAGTEVHVLRSQRRSDLCRYFEAPDLGNIEFPRALSSMTILCHDFVTKIPHHALKVPSVDIPKRILPECAIRNSPVGEERVRAGHPGRHRALRRRAWCADTHLVTLPGRLPRLFWVYTRLALGTTKSVEGILSVALQAMVAATPDLAAVLSNLRTKHRHPRRHLWGVTAP